MGIEIKKEFEFLHKKVKECQQLKQPIEKYVRRQIQIVEQVNDEFVKNAGENIDDYLMQIGYNSQLQALSEKIGAPVEKYLNKIKELSLKLGLED